MQQEYLELADKVINYCSSNAHSMSGILAPVVSFIAVLVSCFAIYYTIRDARVRSLSDRWDQILAYCMDNPKFLDRTYTQDFWTMLNDTEQRQYDAFCYRLWHLMEALVFAGLSAEPRFVAMLEWACYFHGVWLERNPAFFREQRLWTKFDSLRKQPQAVMTYKPLPRKETDIDWDQLKDNYSSRILGPFDEEMLDKVDGKYRNAIIEYLGSSPLLYGRKGWLTSRASCIDLGFLRTQAGTRYGSSHPGGDYGVSGAGY